MIELACGTHALLVDSALFAGPVVLLGGALWIATRRDRRRAASQGIATDGMTTGPRV
jgi:hypothetical protein